MNPLHYPHPERPERHARVLLAGGAAVLTLRHVEAGLMGCRRNPYHFAPATLGGCPWCLRADAGHGDHFPDPRGFAPHQTETPAAAPPAPVRPTGEQRRADPRPGRP